MSHRNTSRAPAPRPHTLDPFHEVKEYMMEAEDYHETLSEKINVSFIHIFLIFAFQILILGKIKLIDMFQSTSKNKFKHQKLIWLVFIADNK